MAAFNHTKQYEREVFRNYKKIATMIKAIISSHININGQIDDFPDLYHDLARYGAGLADWANAFWLQVLTRQALRVQRDFNEFNDRLGKSKISFNKLQPYLASEVYRLQRQQVELITTLPLRAAAEAQELANKAALETGKRAEHLKAQLMGLNPGYPDYAAQRLARTEIAKAQSMLVQNQAHAVGITHFIWRTAGDSAVRDRHAELEGQVFAFNDPPEIEGEGAHLPGQVYNCRCYAEPIIT